MELITIVWPQGTEKVNVDLSRLGDADFEITETCQDVDGKLEPYTTCADFSHRGEDRFRVRIYYGKEVELAARAFNCPWGFLSLELYQGMTTGEATWHDGEFKPSALLPFHVQGISPAELTSFASLTDGEECCGLPPSPRQLWLFRRNVQFWEQQCRVTGLDDPEFLLACHMKPWCTADKREKTGGYNGLLLAPQVEHLFRRHLISFTESGELLVSKRLPDPVRAALLPAKTPAPRPFAATQRRFLEVHRNKFMEMNDVV